MGYLTEKAGYRYFRKIRYSTRRGIGYHKDSNDWTMCWDVGVASAATKISYGFSTGGNFGLPGTLFNYLSSYYIP